MYIVLPTEDILSKYETVEGLFSFMKDGVKALIFHLLVGRMVSDETGIRRYLGLNDILLHFHECYEDMAKEEVNFKLMSIIPLIEQVEMDINKLMADILPNEKIVFDDLISYWVGGDIVLNVKTL